MANTGWYKADAIASPIDGAAVSSWLDSSGNGRTLSQGTGSLQPRLMLDQLNGKPCVRFDGTDDFLASAVNLSAFLGTDGLGTVIAVVRFEKHIANDAAAHGIWGANDSEGNGGSTKQTLRFDTDPDTLESKNYDGSTDAVTTPSPFNTAASGSDPFFGTYLETEPFIAMWWHDPADAGGKDLRVGVNNLDDNALADIGSGASANLALTMLLGRSFEDYWKGDIFEVLFYDTALTEAERRAVVLTLTEKYALPYNCGIASSPDVEPAPVKVEMLLPTIELQVGNNWLSNDNSRSLRPSLWLMADSIVGLSDDDPVTTWPDESGNGYDVTQSGDARPLYKTGIVNGKPVIRFDGTNDRLISADNLEKILGYDGWGIIYAVVRANTIGGGKDHPIFASSSGDIYLTIDETGPVVRGQNDDGTLDNTTDAYTMDAWGIATWMHSSFGGDNDISPNKLGVTLNAKFGGEVDSGITASAELTSIFQVGGDGTDFLDGDIAEILVFPKAHNGDTREHVHSYLKAKYNITASIPTSPELVWLDVTEDVLNREPIRLQSGIRGSDADDRVASPGALRLSMNNAIDNSGSVVGYYSPKHASVRAGWDLGVQIRVSFTHYGTTYYKWNGFVKGINPRPGFESYAVDVEAVDWLDYAGRVTLERLPVRLDEDAGLLFWRLYLNSPRAPESFLIYKGADTFPFAFDRGEDEGLLVLGEIHRLTRSELGYTTIKGNTFGGGQLTFVPRGMRGANTIVRWAMDATDIIRELRLRDYSLDGMANRILLELHPRRVDGAATTELFRLQIELEIPAGATIPFVCPYRDPVSGRFARVGGTEMVTPAQGTDYTMFSATGGGGSNISSDLGVSMTFGGNSAIASLTNNNAGTGYVNLFKLRGKGLYSEEAVIIDKKDQTSINTYGQMTLRIDMPYQSDVALGDALGDALLDNYKEPVPRVKTVGFYANKLSDAMMHALTREPGDRISVTESVSGLSAEEYFIQGIEMYYAQTILSCRWELMPTALEDNLP